MNDDAKEIRKAVRDHTKLFSESLAMIASENLLSPLAREMLISDFHNRYAEGLVGNRYYEGKAYVDKVEAKAIELAKRLFDCQFADVRAVSGTVANMAVYFALTKPGDIVSTLAIADGGHISHASFGALGYRGVKTVHYPFDEENMNIDIQASKRMLKKTRPNLALFGQSAYLFPTPLKELSDVLEDIGCPVCYDGAHVLGLIGGGVFQDPLREGAHIIMGSTHKTLPGPQHGMILANRISDEMSRALERGVFPGVTSNHHLHAMAALAITLAEHIEFGREYSRQTVANAKALGQAMYERGLKVLCPHLGFTESHILMIDVSENGGGDEAAFDLSRANIIVNKNMLPWDHSAKRPSGVRLGTQELTRIGMREGDMDEVADLIRRVVVKKERPERVASSVRELRKGFKGICYCFGKGYPAYDHLGILK